MANSRLLRRRFLSRASRCGRTPGVKGFPCNDFSGSSARTLFRLSVATGYNRWYVRISDARVAHVLRLVERSPA
jgi:hypothetical protein